MQKKLAKNSEIKRFFSDMEIREILTYYLINPKMEYLLSEIYSKKQNRWNDNQELYISNVDNSDNFSSKNWEYYLPKIEKLKPKILTFVDSSYVNLKNIRNLESLEEVNFLFEDFNFLRIDKKEILVLFDNIKDCYNLKKLSISFSLFGGGSFGDHQRNIVKFYNLLIKFFPKASYVEGSYFPSVFKLV